MSPTDESFPLRHRGVHVPDHLRRLELVSSGSFSRSPRASTVASRPLALPQAKRDFIALRQRPADDHLAAFFGNLSVWIEQAVGTTTVHAGYDKALLYVALLRVFVDEVVPNERLRQIVEDIASYMTYLISSAPEAAVPIATQRPAWPAATEVRSPRSDAVKGVLSPRAIRERAKDAAREAARSPLAPRITRWRPKKIIELSEHEEAILEIALFYEEAVAQLCAQAKATRLKMQVKTLSTVTQRWSQLPVEMRTRRLKKVKSKLAKQTLLGTASTWGAGPAVGASATRGTTPSTPTTGVRTGSAYRAEPSNPTVITTQGLDISSYFSLVMLCFQETTRRISVFSAEIAAFLWGSVCHDTLRIVESVFDEVLIMQRRSTEELQEQKASRGHVQDAIAHCEREIQRLQAQNMRSLDMWRLEREEMRMLEQEEEWHGHCKALLLKSLKSLQRDANRATWLQVRPPAATTKEAMTTMTNYHRLPAGGALLHFRQRSRILYIAHLVSLCRCFLHLREKRKLREVMESTSPNPRWSVEMNSPPSPSATSPSLDPYDQFATSVHPATPMHTGNAMERISLSELLTLKDINGTLRAIEQLYATTGGSGESYTRSYNNGGIFRIRGHDAATQYPDIGEIYQPSPGSPSFLRSLSYCTMAANSLANAPAFVKAGSSRSLTPTTAKRRNAEIVVSHSQLSMGSGRRRSSANASTNNDPSAMANAPSVLRLYKILPMLPKHVREVLILPLLEAEPFLADDTASIAPVMTKEEILQRIQSMYSAIIESSFDSKTTSDASRKEGCAILLSRHLWKSWKSEQFVEFVHSMFITQANEDIRQGERSFITFLASIQLLFSGLGAALNPTTGGSGPLQTMDTIYFFARMARLFNLEAHDKITKNRLPSQVFPIFFYCLHVLQHVTIVKKHIEEGGLSLDVWVAATSASRRVPTTPNAPKNPRLMRTASSSSSPFASSRSVMPPAKFVLLESAKTLLFYLLESTSSDASVLIDNKISFLSDRASVAKVALVSPLIPGAYDVAAATVPSISSAFPTPSGELGDAAILPLDQVVHTITAAWLEQHRALLDRLTIAMRAANISKSGEITFDEFQHVMTVGSAATASCVTPMSSGQLAQIYASLVSEHSAHKRGVKWPELITTIADEIDLLGVTERLQNTDIRSIQRSLLRSRGGPASAWVLNASYRGGDAAALHKAWELNHRSMYEHFSLTFQADNSIEGVRLWQSGLARMRRVETLLADNQRSTPVTRQQRKSQTGDTPPDASMGKEELEVAWRALYYLQLDHAQANRIADQVQFRQQRQQQRNLKAA